MWTAGSVSASALARSSLFSWTYNSFTSYDASTGTISWAIVKKARKEKMLTQESPTYHCLKISIHVAILPLSDQKWEDDLSCITIPRILFSINKPRPALTMPDLDNVPGVRLSYSLLKQVNKLLDAFIYATWVSLQHQLWSFRLLILRVDPSETCRKQSVIKMSSMGINWKL